MIGIDQFVRGNGHRAGVAVDDAQQIRLRLVMGVEAALEAMIPVIVAAHRGVVEKLNGAIDAVAAQVGEPAAALEDPLLDTAVHLDRPILGMHAEHENAITAQVQITGVQLIVYI